MRCALCLPLLFLGLASLPAEAGLGALARIASHAGKVGAKAGKGAAAAGKGAASAGKGAGLVKGGALLGGTGAMLASERAALVFAGLADDGLGAAVYMTHESADLVRVLPRGGSAQVVPEHQLGAVLSELSPIDGGPVDVYLELSQSLRLSSSPRIPGRLHALDAQGTPHPIRWETVKDGVEAMVDIGGMALDAEQFAASEATNGHSDWPLEGTLQVLPLGQARCSDQPAADLMSLAPEDLDSSDPAVVRAWVADHSALRLLVLAAPGTSLEPVISAAQEQDHSLTALALAAPPCGTELLPWLTTAIERVEDQQDHAPFLDLAPLQNVFTQAADTLQISGEFAQRDDSIPFAAGAWVVPWPVEPPLEPQAAETTSDFYSAMGGFSIMLLAVALVIRKVKTDSARAPGRTSTPPGDAPGCARGRAAAREIGSPGGGSE